MPPKQKAITLIEKCKQAISTEMVLMLSDGKHDYELQQAAEQCALLIVEETISNIQPADDKHMKYWSETNFEGYRQYWQQVKKEIELL